MEGVVISKKWATAHLLAFYGQPEDDPGPWVSVINCVIHEHHQVVNTKIRLIIFFAAKDGEVPYSQQKQDWELTVAQIMNSLLPNSD